MSVCFFVPQKGPFLKTCFLQHSSFPKALYRVLNGAGNFFSGHFGLLEVFSFFPFDLIIGVHICIVSGAKLSVVSVYLLNSGVHYLAMFELFQCFIFALFAILFQFDFSCYFAKLEISNPIEGYCQNCPRGCKFGLQI